LKKKLPRRSSAPRPSHGAGLILIGIYKICEGLLLAAAGVGVLHLLHRDMETVLLHWVHVLRVDPDNRYIHGLLERAFAINPKQLRELSVGTFVYAAMRLTEGLGLVARRKWAEYLTVILTALFIPLELFEMFRHFTWVKAAVFAANVIVVVYLLMVMRKASFINKS
jgi:uncharacterized membrane protein (DUF2068 family)